MPFDTQQGQDNRQHADSRQRLLYAFVVAYAFWLLLTWYGTATLRSHTNRDDLVRVAMWGISIVFGGLFLVYTWSIAAGIIARERLRGTLTRGIALADQALEEANQSQARGSAGN